MKTRQSFRLLLPALTLITFSGSASTSLAGDTWDGGGGDNNWGTGANWNPDGSPSPGSASDLFFAGASQLTSNNNYTAFDDFRNITFNSGAGAFTLTGNSIDLFGKIENLSTSTQTVNLTSIALNSATANEFNPVSGHLNIGGNVITNGNQLKVFGNNGFTLTFGSSSIISGSGGSVAINQNSNVVYQSAHTYSGDTFVNAGSLQFAQSGSANSSIIRLGDTITNSPVATVSITDADGGTTVASTIVVRPSASGTQGTRTISGTNTSGTNTFSGGIALDTVATITATNAGGTLAFTGSTLELKTFGLLVNGAGNSTISNAITSTGAGNALTKSGTGTLTLSGSNSYTGGTTVTAGTLKQGVANAIGTTTNALTVSGGIFDLGGFALSSTSLTGTAGSIINSSATAATLTRTGTASTTLASVLGGTGTNSNNFAVAMNGLGGTLVLAPTFSSAVTNTSATNTLILPTGTSAVSVGQGVTGTGVVAGSVVTAVSVSGATTTVTLSANTTAAVATASFNGSTYNGGTTLTAGTLTINQGSNYSGSTLLSGGVGTGTLTLNGGSVASNSSIGNNVSIAGNITLTSAGRFGLQGAVIDLTSGTRTLSLNRANLNTIATTPNANLLLSNGAPAVTVQNGTLRIVTDPSVAVGNFTTVQFAGNPVSFTGNAGLTIGDRVVTNLTSSAFGAVASTTLPAVTVEAGGYFNMTNFSGTGSPANVFSLSGAGTVTNLNTTAGAALLTITGSANTTFSGLIVDGASLQTTFSGATRLGNVALTKMGASILTLTGTGSTYSGGTNLITGSIGIGSNTALGTGVLNLGGTNADTPTIFASGGARSISNTVTLLATSVAGNPTISGSNDLTLSGVVTANGATRTLSVNNTGLTTLSGNVFLSNDNSTTGRGLIITGTGNTSISGVIANNNAGNTVAATLTKSGTGTLTLANSNTFTGATQVNAGKLLVGNGVSGSLGNTIVNVGGAAASGTPTLGGSGTIGGATTLSTASGGAAGTHAPGIAGVNNGVGQQTFSSTLSYGTGSIFEWDLQATSTTDPGVVADAATGTYDSVVANGSAGSVTGGTALFKIVLGGNTFTDAFWNTNKSWTNIFTGSGAPALLSSLFGSFSPTGGLASDGTVLGEGQFTFNGSSSTLNWTVVPEPTTALAGLLLGAGLLRRRRA